MGKRFSFKDYFSETELKKMVEPELKKMAEEIANDMRHYSFNTLWEFYLDYSPYEYNRLYSLIAQGDSANSTFPKIKIVKTKEGYRVELEYNASVMSAFHNDGYEWGGMTRGQHIFNGPFIQGYHGGPIFVVDSYRLNSRGKYVIDDWHTEPAPQMIPSPWERIYEYARIKYRAHV